MHTIPIVEVMKQLPISEVEETLDNFLRPIMERLPDKRLGRIVPLGVQGILGSESPVILQMAQSIAHSEGETWPVAKRLYGLLWNERFSHARKARVTKMQTHWLVSHPPAWQRTGSLGYRGL